MKCPKCGGDAGVMETRDSAGRLRRRRKCGDCGERFTTLEVVVGSDERSWHGARVVIFTQAQAKAWREAMQGMADVLAVGEPIDDDDPS